MTLASQRSASERRPESEPEQGRAASADAGKDVGEVVRPKAQSTVESAADSMTGALPDQGGRPRQVDDDQVFEAVAAVITEHGPSGLTLNRVGDMLGVTGPALGYRFQNKRGLLLAFAGRQPSATNEHFVHTIAHSRSERSALVECLCGFGAGMQTKVQVANNVAMLALDLADDEFGQHAQAQARVVKAHIKALLAKAGVSPERLADIVDELYVTWNGAALAWAIDGEGSLENWVRLRIERILNRELP